MMIETLFVLSIMMNITLAVCSVKFARRLLTVGTNIDTVYEIMDSFRSHVEQVHEAEMFYGDQTLQAMIDHSKELLSTLDEYSDLMELVSIEEGEDATEED
jgi:hypothetical protein